jgi:hypothetical protein
MAYGSDAGSFTTCALQQSDLLCVGDDPISYFAQLLRLWHGGLYPFMLQQLSDHCPASAVFASEPRAV